MRGNLPNDARQRRDLIEEAMFNLASVERDLAEVELRIQQAIRRSAQVTTVLDPANTRLASVVKRIRLARASLTDHWSAQAPQRWGRDDDPPAAE